MAGKALFRDHLREFTEAELKESFDNQTDVTRSKMMAKFFAERTLAPRNPTLLPFGEEELAACMVDQKGDQGVDFISRENGNVLIIQAKFSGGKKLSKRPIEVPADFEHFRSVLQRLRNYQALEMCQPLREVCADIDWEVDTFDMYYITLRQLSINQKAGDDHTIHQTGKATDRLDPDRVTVHLYDEVKLNEELRDSLNLNESTSRPAVVRFTPNAPHPAYIQLASDQSGRSCYVGRISGAQLAGLFVQQHRSRLFNLNIRNYLGDNATNKAIRKTAIESPEEFFFFNNGISALANRVEPDPTDTTETTLRCENLSVINGAQTVRSLHKAHALNPSIVREVQVLLRLTEVGPKKTRNEQEFLDNVTKYNNTQTSIRLSDFRSNDKVQNDIANKFAQLPAVDGKKFVYKNKRTGETVNGRSIGMEEFVKTVYAFRFGPDDVFGGTAYVFDATRDGGYTKLFGDNGEILPTLDNSTFALYAGIWFVCAAARELWRERSTQSLDPALERRWMFFYGLGIVLKHAYTTLDRDLDADLRKLGDPSWMRKGAGGHPSRAIGAICRFTFKALTDAYRQASEKPGFAHRNWFRSPNSLTSIVENVASSWDLVSLHAEDYILLK